MVACAAFVHHSISMDENVGGKIVHQSKKIMWIQLLYHVSRGILDTECFPFIINKQPFVSYEELYSSVLIKVVEDWFGYFVSTIDMVFKGRRVLRII